MFVIKLCIYSVFTKLINYPIISDSARRGLRVKSAIIVVPNRGAEYCDDRVCLCVCVCLSASISLEIHDRCLANYCACCLWPGSDLLWRRRDTLCTSGFMDDVMLAHKPRQLNVAAQLIEAQPTCSLRLGYERRVGIPFADEWTHTHGPTFRTPRSGPTIAHDVPAYIAT